MILSTCNQTLTLSMLGHKPGKCPSTHPSAKLFFSTQKKNFVHNTLLANPHLLVLTKLFTSGLPYKLILSLASTLINKKKLMVREKYSVTWNKSIIMHLQMQNYWPISVWNGNGTQPTTSLFTASKWSKAKPYALLNLLGDDVA